VIIGQSAATMPEDAAAEAYAMLFLVESGFAQKSRG
jgi:hypothetical protein